MSAFRRSTIGILRECGSFAMIAPMSISPARKTIAALATCQGLLATNNVLNYSVTGLAAYAFADDKAWATLPLTAYIVGTALATVPASFWMRRVGRRLGFITGAALAVVGSIINGIGIIEQSFWLLVLGTFVSGGYNAFGLYYRFAAAEAVSHEWKPKAISYVLLGSVAGAIVGPELSLFAIDGFPIHFLGAYVFLGICALTAMALQIIAPLAVAPVTEASDEVARPLARIITQPLFVIALLSAVVGYATMNFLMTSTPMAMTQMHHSYNATTSVLEWHSVAMYAPSFITGTLIRRAGIFNVMTMGALLMLTAVAVAEWDTGVAFFWVALVLVGMGWNFLYVSGTTLLTNCYRPCERAQAQGCNDLLVFAGTGTASLMSGVLLQHLGWHSLVLTAVPLLVVMLGILVWARRRLDPLASIAR
jgi:predicted MFS family arabinose efflux permease